MMQRWGSRNPDLPTEAQVRNSQVRRSLVAGPSLGSAQLGSMEAVALVTGTGPDPAAPWFSSAMLHRLVDAGMMQPCRPWHNTTRSHPHPRPRPRLRPLLHSSSTRSGPRRPVTMPNPEHEPLPAEPSWALRCRGGFPDSLLSPISHQDPRSEGARLANDLSPFPGGTRQDGAGRGQNGA